jgi:D-amino-acid dehydrogenase
VTSHEVQLETGERIEADAVLVAAGALSAGLLRPLGLRVPLIAERGYHLHAAESDWPLDLPPVVFEERSMIVTRFRSGLRAAGFFEFARPEAPPDPRKWARLRSNLEALGIAFADPVEWSGARPTLPDYLPAIGRTADGLFYAFGHQHLGLTLAAATGEAIAALAAGDAPPFDLSPFAIERFGRRRG